MPHRLSNLSSPPIENKYFYKCFEEWTMTTSNIRTDLQHETNQYHSQKFPSDWGIMTTLSHWIHSTVNIKTLGIMLPWPIGISLKIELVSKMHYAPCCGMKQGHFWVFLVSVSVNLYRQIHRILIKLLSLNFSGLVVLASNRKEMSNNGNKTWPLKMTYIILFYFIYLTKFTLLSNLKKWTLILFII